MRLVNVGDVPTCVRPQGSSIVDLTWASPELVTDVHDWRVRTDLESLSDHQYVMFSVGGGTGSYVPRGPTPKRWNLKKLDEDMFQWAITWHCSTGPSEETVSSASKYSEWVDWVMTDSADASAPRCFSKKTRKQAYWWNEELGEIRRACIRSKRAWTRSKRRRHSLPEEIDNFGREYKQKRNDLRDAIKKAKSTAWSELIETIDKDPWGLPYRIVLNRLRQSSPSLTETLERDTLEVLLNDLFPRGRTHDPATIWQDWRREDWNSEWDIPTCDVYRVVKERFSANVAPGPDGIKASLWKKVPNMMVDRLTECFNACLREGIFPAKWKVANLVLIPKDKQPANVDGPLRVRPICLINEVGKIFERLIVDRLHAYMKEHPRADYYDNQFGFRKNRSTYDALARIQELTNEAVRRGGVAIAVSLDVANAFNSVPWPKIRRALKRKGFPNYLRRIIDAYLFERYITYRDNSGSIRYKPMTAGVPQGSIAGPTLWNITYDTVLRSRLEEGCTVTCYADDILILVTAEDVPGACWKANLTIRYITRQIKSLGLKLSEPKTEAILFHGRNRRPDCYPTIEVGAHMIRTKEAMKYLGIILDSRGNFLRHFAYIEGKAGRVLRAMGRLMPNLRG